MSMRRLVFLCVFLDTLPSLPSYVYVVFDMVLRSHG